MVKYAKTKKLNGFEALDKFIFNELKNLYSDDYFIEFAVEGLTSQSDSTTPLIYLFASIDKKRFKDIWEGFIFGALTNKSALKGGMIPGMNASSYPIFLTYAQHAWINKLISDDEFIYAVKKMYTIFGRQGYARTIKDWNNDALAHNKRFPHWKAIPDKDYVNNVMPESIWETGESQGYFINWFAAPVVKLKPYEDQNDRVFRNLYYQFAAPFQSHGEPYSYGKAFSFNLLKTVSVVEEKEQWILKFNKPNLPIKMPCFGVVDITDIVCLEKSLMKLSGREINGVVCNGKALEYEFTSITEYEKVDSLIDNKKLVFILPEHAVGEVEIKLLIKAK